MGYRQNLRPNPTPGMDTMDMVVIMVGMDTLTGDITDTTEENDLPMLNQKQKQMLKPSLGMAMVMLVITVIHTLMVDTDTHILITTLERDLLATLERDLLMLNQKLKASHGMDMDTLDTVMDIVLTATDTVVITMDKPLNFISIKLS